jgi:hypothetical protein
MTTYGNTGHGHVWPRLDGIKARCGGPKICRECALDKARLDAETEGQEQCAYCWNWFPKPISYHHSEEECAATPFLIPDFLRKK